MRSVVLALVAVVAVAGCGKEIGDECIISADCDPNGTRQCDQSQRGGYCTIQGCDVNTCPEEATCIRFFTGGFDNRLCEVQADCSLDELCSIRGQCVPRNSEIRNCMRTCDSHGDCRDGYECRDLDLMREHGGQPVLAPGVPVDERAPKFCAAAPAA